MSLALIGSMRRGAAFQVNISEFMTGADPSCPNISSGDTAWMMTATGFVLFMTPGLSFFYGGLVPRKSVLTIMMQCFISISATSIAWAFLGFSLAFGDSWGGSGFIGNPGSFPLFIGLDMCEPWPGTRIPSLLFAGYQMMFAVIAPALITGAFADRVLFAPYLIFIVLWVLLVYCPFTHWIWNPQGFLAIWGVVDFAGGIVVHISAGFAALASVFVVGPRQYNSEFQRELSRVPHNRAFVALGTGMLWMGWFGFNGGSGVSASSRDSFALVNSTLAASFAMFTWMALEWHHVGKPQLVGACVGAVGGLATVTPAAGFVRPWAAMLIGTLSAPFCFACVMLRTWLAWDDALDVWGVHGMGGLFGSILIGALADQSVGGIERSWTLLGKQIAACAFTLVYAFVLSYLLLLLVRLCLPLVPPADIVEAGLDQTIHGEHAYDSDHIASTGLVALPYPVNPDSFYPSAPMASRAEPAAGEAARKPLGPAGSLAAGSSATPAHGHPPHLAGEPELVRMRREMDRLMALVHEMRGDPPPPRKSAANGEADAVRALSPEVGGGGKPAATADDDFCTPRTRMRAWEPEAGAAPASLAVAGPTAVEEAEEEGLSGAPGSDH